MKKNNILKFINIIYFSFSIICIFFVYNFNSNDKYELLICLPIVFCMSHLIYLHKIIYSNNLIFRFVFLAVEFLRYCVSPVLMIYNNEYDSIVSRYIPTKANVTTAIICMIIEIIVCTFILYIWDIKNKRTNKTFKYTKIQLPKKYDVYIVFIIFTLCLTMLFPDSIGQFHFFIFSNEELNIINDSTSFLLELTIMCLIVSKNLIYIIFMCLLNKKYRKTLLKRYVVLSFIISLVNGSIYNGGNRSQFIFTVIASVIIFGALYPDYVKKLIIPSTFLIIIVISYIYETRNYYDYYSNLSGISYITHTIQSNIDAYFGGVNLVSVGMATKSYFPQNANILNFLFDCIRPIVGINLLVKGINMSWSNVYYNAVAGLGKRSALIFPSISQGYFYFGFFGCYIISLFILFLALFLEKKMNKSRRIELIYFFTLVLLRLGTFSGINITIALNELSFQLLLFMLIFYFNNKIKIFSK